MACRKDVANRIYPVVAVRHPVSGRKNHVGFGNNNVVKMKSDMAQKWKPLVFTLKPVLLTESGQKETAGGGGIENQGAKEPGNCGAASDSSPRRQPWV